MNAVDIVVILFVAVVALISAKRGFIWSILNFGVVVASGVLSRLLAGPASELFYQYFLHNKILAELYKILPEGSVSGQIGAGVESVLSELPVPVIAIAKQLGLYPDLSGNTQILTVEGIEEDYIVPILTGVLSVIATILLFIIIYAVLKIIARAIDRNLSDKDKHRFVSRTNTLLGALMGILKGGVLAALACAAFILIAPISGNNQLISLANGSYFCTIIARFFG